LYKCDTLIAASSVSLIVYPSACLKLDDL